MVLMGFMAAWFLAASPIKRSSAVKETKEGVVKLPCSFATIWGQMISIRPGYRHTDFDIVSLVVGDAGISGACKRHVSAIEVGKTAQLRSRKRRMYPGQCQWRHRKLRQPWLGRVRRRNIREERGECECGRYNPNEGNVGIFKNEENVVEAHQARAHGLVL